MTEEEANQQTREINEDVQRDNGMLPPVRSEPLLDDRGPTCVVCGNRLEWIECDQCDSDGFVDHDCGEDCCCCADPEPNVRCGQCDGKGGWWQCYSCTSNTPAHVRPASREAVGSAGG